LLLMVGNWRMKPAPKVQLLNSFVGDRKAEKAVGLTSNGGVLATGLKGWTPDQRHDRAGDNVPIVVDMNWDHRLDIQDVLGTLVGANIEVDGVLERHTDEVRNRVLQFCGKCRCVIPARCRGGSWVSMDLQSVR
jgi:hypothetical protein